MSLISRLIIIATLLTILCVQRGTTKRNFEITFDNITCVSYTELFQKFTCAITRARRNRNFYPALTIFVKLTEDYYLSRLEWRIVLLMNGREVPMLDMVVDFCELMRSGSSIVPIKVMLDQFKDSRISNIPARCPFLKNKEYFFKNTYIDQELLPPYTPRTHFYITLVLRNMQTNQTIIYFDLQANVVDKKN